MPVGVGQADARSRRRGRACSRPRRRRASPVAAAPATPHSAISALASLSLHLARSTNIDRRFSVGASTLGGQAAGTRRRPAARRRSSPAGGPWPSRSRPGAPDPGRGRDVVGELALQERGGVGAAGADDAPVGRARQAPSREIVAMACAIIISRHDMRGAGAGALARSSRGDESLALRCSCCCSSPRRRRLRRPGGGCTGRCRWPPNRRAVDRARHARRARSPTPGCGPACRPSPLLLYEWFRWSGQARQIRAGSYEIGRRHHADRACSTRWCAATRRSAACASSKAGPSARSAPSSRKRRGAEADHRRR